MPVVSHQEPHHLPQPSAHLGLALALGIGGGLIFAMVSSLVVTNRAAAILTPTLSPRQAAEAGLNKALYCLNATVGTNCGGSHDGQFRGETAAVYGEASFTTVVTGDGHRRHLESVGRSGTEPSYAVTVDAVDLPPAVTPDFAYALQAGDGGLTLGSRTTITGNIRSAAGLACQPGPATVIGDVTAAGGAVNCSVKGRAFTEATLAGGAGPAIDLAPWEAAAADDETGTVHPANGSHLGPLKVEGDLDVANGVSVRIDGIIWVTGTLVVRAGGRLVLNPAFGTYGTVIVAKRVVIEAGAVLEGSGTPGSGFLLVATAGDDTPAMTLAGAPGAALFLAPNGWLKIADRARLEAAAARRLTVGQRATVTHLHKHDGSAAPAFAPYPGGDWRFLNETWK